MVTRIFAVTVVTAAAMLAVGCGEGPTYNYPVPEPPKPKPPVPADYSYTELPEPPADELLAENGGDWQKITHFSTFGGAYTRNYSMLYDRVEKVSYWVAYPMHRVWISGNGVRGNYFMYDPYVDNSLQMPVTGTTGYGEDRYQRGHQIASADRLSSQAANDQTFYVTNITPQNGDLNGGTDAWRNKAWAALEAWVRNRALEPRREDTLYVVTGCWLGENHKHLSRRGNGAIPDAYYKVLLRTASGGNKFPEDDDCELVGFWYENETPAGDGLYRDHTMSVAEIERRTGFDFFPSISNEAQNENDSPSKWSGL